MVSFGLFGLSLGSQRPKSPKSMPKMGLDFGLIGGGIFGCTFGDFWPRKLILANPYRVFCGSIAFDSTIYCVWWPPGRVKIDGCTS